MKRHQAHPRVIRSRDLVHDVVQSTHPVKGMAAELRRHAMSVARTVRESDSDAGEHGVDHIWERLDHAAEERSAGPFRRASVQLDVAELGTQPMAREMQLAFRRADLAGIDVHVPDLRLGNVPALRCARPTRRDRTGPVTKETAMARAAGGCGRAAGATRAGSPDVIEREQCVPPELDDSDFRERAQRSTVDMARTHRRVRSRGAVPPREHRLQIQPIPGGHGPGRVFRPLEFGSSSRRRAGAAVSKAAYTASSPSRVKDALWLPGTTHLAALQNRS